MSVAYFPQNYFAEGYFPPGAYWAIYSTPTPPITPITPPNVSRFPNASASPRAINDVYRVIQLIQSAVDMTIPEIPTLPANPYPGQIVLHYSAVDTINMKWYDQANGVWHTLSSAPAAGISATFNPNSITSMTFVNGILTAYS